MHAGKREILVVKRNHGAVCENERVDWVRNEGQGGTREAGYTGNNNKTRERTDAESHTKKKNDGRDRAEARENT